VDGNKRDGKVKYLELVSGELGKTKFQIRKALLCPSRQISKERVLTKTTNTWEATVFRSAPKKMWAESVSRKKRQPFWDWARWIGCMRIEKGKS